jgi:hypothetical protein
LDTINGIAMGIAQERGRFSRQDRTAHSILALSAGCCWEVEPDHELPFLGQIFQVSTTVTVTFSSHLL